MDYRMAIDVGTLSTRVALFDRRERVVYQRGDPLDLLCSSDATTDVTIQAKVEQDGEQIVRLTSNLVADAQRFATSASRTISAAAVATQRSSVLAWRRSDGAALTPVLSWQDRRTHAWLAEQAIDEDWLFRRTGLPRSAHYGASKLRWLRDNLCTGDTHNLCMGPLAAFVVQRLTQECHSRVDVTNAARMQLVDLAEPTKWDATLLDLFGLQRSWLPQIRPTRYHYGHLKPSGADTRPHDRVPIKAVCGDQFAALHAMRLAPGEALLNLGTGGFLMIASHGPAPDRLLRSPGPAGSVLIEGTVNGVGAALEWAAAKYGVDLQTLPWDSWAEERVGSEGWQFENRIGGRGSPWWQPTGRSYWVNPSGCEERPKHVRTAMVAVVESIAELVAVNVRSIREAGVPIDRLQVTGGVSRIRILIDRIAKYANCPAIVAEMDEATALGAVRLLTFPV